LHIGRSIDAARRRLVVRPPETAGGAAVVHAIKALFDERPELASYDIVYNLLRFTGDLGNEHIVAIARHYAPLPREPGDKYVAFLSLDPHFPRWAKAMDAYFTDRIHKVFESQLTADGFLDRARAEAG